MKTTKCIYDLCPCDKSMGDFSPKCGHCPANSYQLPHLWDAKGDGGWAHSVPCAHQACSPHPTGGIGTWERGRLCAVRKMAARLPPSHPPPVGARLPCIGLPVQFRAAWPWFISSIPFCACLRVWGVRFFHSLKVIRSGQFSPESLKASGESGKSH